MKQTINKHHKGVLTLASLLNVALFFMAVLPWVLYGEGFWEQSILFNVLGVILGISWFLLALLFFYANITMFIPKLNLHNIIHIINLALFLSLLIVLDSDQIINIEKGIMLIAVIGIVMIVINVVQYLVYKKTEHKGFEIVEIAIKNLLGDDIEQNKVSFLYHYFVIGLFVLFFINADVIYASAYYLIFIYTYFKHTHIPKMQMIIYLCISILLATGVIILIGHYEEFFESHQMFETLLLSIPLLHLMPPIVKAYHKIILSQLIE
jgi:hypothetical protein